jgi:hypothetical protein
LRERHVQQLKQYEQDLAAWNADRSNVDRGEKPERPEMEHYFSTDSTPEALARMLGHPQSCTAGFVIIRDELVAFVRNFDAYKSGRGGERQAWLSLWAGAELKSDRAGRDPYYIASPTISVVGGIQPDSLGALEAEAGQKDGFIERFLFAYPDTRPMRWREETVSRTTIDAMTAVFRALRRAGAGGAVALHPDALAVFRTWVDDNAAAQERLSGLMRGVASKLPNQAGRLALILHALAHPGDAAAVPVSRQTMAHALELTEYFRAHAARTVVHFGEGVSAGHPLGMRVLRVLREMSGWVKRGELYQRLGGHVRAAEVSAALIDLARTGRAESRAVPSGDRGGRPGEEWRAVAFSEKGTEQSQETEQTEETVDAAEVSSVLSVISPNADADEEVFEL